MKKVFSPRELLAPANIVSFLRIPLGVLIIVFFEDSWLALSLLLIAILTDAADGYLARRHGSTPFGPVIDVVCDKVMVGMLLLFFLVSRVISIEGLVLFLLRDVFIVILSACLMLKHRERALSFAKARWPGKIVTVAQFATIVSLIVLPGYSGYMVYLVAALSVAAIADYVMAVKKSV
jgi:phosphatidylglycerophosphate synthase